MVFAPVRITTYSRFEHFRRCVESLARCKGADQTEVFIGIDYPKNEEDSVGNTKIREFADTISGFKAVYVSKRDENLGQLFNGRDLLAQIRERGYDRFIDVEDDLEFAPNFLEYMNQCLEKYEDDPRVFSVCGYSYLEWAGKTGSVGNAFPMKGFCAWGTGYWMAKNRAYSLSALPAKDIIFNPDIVRYLFANKMHHTVHYLMFRYKTNAADLRRCCFYTLNGKYSIYPRVSKVRNWGFDSSASHCAEISAFARQEIDRETDFSLDDFEIGPAPDTDRLHDLHYAQGLGVRLLTRIEYAQWRITGKAFRDYGAILKLLKARVRRRNK